MTARNARRAQHPDIFTVRLDHPADTRTWRAATRRLDAAGVAPERIDWRIAGDDEPGLLPDMFAAAEQSWDSLPDAPARNVPGAFISLADKVLCHRAGDRFALAYRLYQRLRRTPALLSIASDDDVHRAHLLAKAVSRDAHKMKAFVRFREVAGPGPDDPAHFVAWFEPSHHTLDATAPFFMRRYAGQSWSILTPDRCAHWDGKALTMSAGVPKSAAPSGDPAEDLWRTYFASTFNPARLMVKAMTAEMPKKYWKNMPEASLIAPLIEGARGRHETMIDTAPQPAARTTRIRQSHQSAAEAIAQAPIHSLDDLARMGATCTRCPLHSNATQAVPGEGPADASLMLVGEQPGDHEDVAGLPFAGPAGQVLDDALSAAGIIRDRTFVTNAVKHFKHELRGRRRLHRTPDAGEVFHCSWWLDLERALLRPKLIIALGATAGRALTGQPVSIARSRGMVMPLDGQSDLLITTHPSAILRQPDRNKAEDMRQAFVEDLKIAKAAIAT
ncbi:MAG: UdgX family uracil-DNA binding protein [Pseudomonadota bacterium]